MLDPAGEQQDSSTVGHPGLQVTEVMQKSRAHSSQAKQQAEGRSGTYLPGRAARTQADGYGTLGWFRQQQGAQDMIPNFYLLTPKALG